MFPVVFVIVDCFDCATEDLFALFLWLLSEINWTKICCGLFPWSACGPQTHDDPSVHGPETVTITFSRSVWNGGL